MAEEDDDDDEAAGGNAVGGSATAGGGGGGESLALVLSDCRIAWTRNGNKTSSLGPDRGVPKVALETNASPP